MAEPTPITQSQLRSALVRKGIILMDYASPQLVSEAIRRFEIELAIMPGVRPATSFSACFQAIYGQSLDGKPCKPKTKRKSPAQAVG